MGPSKTLVTCEQNSKQCSLGLTLSTGTRDFNPTTEVVTEKRPQGRDRSRRPGRLARGPEEEKPQGEDEEQEALCRGRQGRPSGPVPTSVSSERGGTANSSFKPADSITVRKQCSFFEDTKQVVYH